VTAKLPVAGRPYNDNFCFYNSSLASAGESHFPASVPSQGIAMILFRSPIFSALDSIQLGDRAQLQSSPNLPSLLVNWGSAVVDIGADTRLGSILAVGPVTLRDRALVDGSIQTASTVTRQTGTVVTETVTENATLQLPTVPSITTAWPSSPQAGFIVPSGTQASKDAGAFGDVAVQSGGTLTLSAGTYFFGSLVLEAGGVIRTTGATVIEVRDSLALRAKILDSSGNTASISLRYRGTAAATVEQSFRGSILSPSAQLILGSSGAQEYRGQFLGKQLVLRPDIVGVAEIPADGGLFPTTQKTVLPMLGAAHGIVLGNGSWVQAPTNTLIQLINWGAEPVVLGDNAFSGPISSIGSVDLGLRAQVDGDVETAGKVIRGQGSVVTGTVTESTTPVLPFQPAPAESWPTANQGAVVVDPGIQKSLTPGAYGSLSLGAGSRIILASGHYWFTSIALPLDAAIEVHGDVIVEARDGLAVYGKIVDASGSPAAVQVLYWGTFPATIASPFLGSVQAPHAQLTIGGAGVTVQGQVYAQQLLVEPNTILLPPTSVVPGIFTPTTPTPDPTARTFTGPARVVVPKTATTVPTQVVVQGAESSGVIDASVGGEIWVTPLGNAPWTLVVQTKNAQGVWTNVPTSDGNTVSANGVKISAVVVAAQGSNPSFVVQVQQQESTPSVGTWTVTGTVTWTDGRPFIGIIQAYDKDLRDNQYLGTANTDSTGKYTIQFSQEQFEAFEFNSPDIFIQAYQSSQGTSLGTFIEQSAVTFNASSPTTINLVLSSVQPSPLSEYERLDFLIHPLLEGDASAPEKLNLDSDAQFLSNELGESLDRIQFYIQANIESKRGVTTAPVPATAYYGLYRKSFPIKTELLCRRTESDIKSGLDQAIADGIIDLSKLGTNSGDIAKVIAGYQSSHLTTTLKNFGVQTWVKPDNLPALVTLLKTSTTPKEFWQQAQSQGLLSPTDAPKMKTFYSLLEVVGGNHSMVSNLLGALPTGATDASGLVTLSVERLKDILHNSYAVSSKITDDEVTAIAQNLAQVIERAFTKEALVNNLQQVSTIDFTRVKILLQNNPGIDPRLPLPAVPPLVTTGLSSTDFATVVGEMEKLRLQLALYPVPLQGTTPEERRANLVAQLQSFSSNFASPVIKEVQDLLQAASDFRFGRDRVQDLFANHASFFTGKSKELVDETQRWVRTIARLYAVYPSTAVATYLLSCGYKSAGQIARTSRVKFIASFDPTYGTDIANTVHRTARRIVQTSIQMHGLLQSSQSSLPVYALGTDQSSTESSEISWASLFGRPVSVRVPEWRSILSPAAYFVELLRYLESLDAPSGKAQPYQALIQRRPDLVHIALDKTSTFSEISHSQLVLEILQAFVAYSHSWTSSTWESISWPQIQDQADAALRSAVGYPFELPVDAQKHDQDLLLGCVDLRLADLGTTLVGCGTSAERDRLTKSTLGLSSGQFAILVEPSTSSVDISHLVALWGVDAAGLDGLRTKVAQFLDQARITFIELKQYSISTFAQGAVSVSVPDGVDLDSLAFGSALANADLHRANRFFRLLKQLRLIDPTRTVHDLDAALQAFGSDITAVSLQKLAAVVRISRRLGTGWYQVLSLFANLDTKSGLVEGDDGDLVEDLSWYAQVYRVAESGTDADFQINASKKDVTGLGKSLASKATTVRGALGITSDTLSAIISLLGIDATSLNTFNLANLSSIYRVQLLSNLLATDPENVFLVSSLLKHEDLFHPEIFETFLDDWDAFSTLSVSAGTLRYLYKDSIIGTDAIIPLSDASLIKSIIAGIVDGYSAIEAGFAGLSGGDSDNDIDAIRKVKRTEIIGKTLGEALGVDPAMVLYLLENQLIMPSTGAKDIDYLLLLDTDPTSDSWKLFASLLIRLQKATIFVAAMSLDSDELTAITTAKAAWDGFDLNSFTEACSGTIASVPNAAAAAWFGIIFRYIYVRKQILASSSDSVSPLLAIWPLALDANKLATVTEWSAADILALATLRIPAGNATNQIAYSLVASVNLVHKLGRPAGTLIQWIQADDGDSGITTAIMDAVRQKFDTDNWALAEAKYLVSSRNFRRENLIQYVLQMSEIPSQVNTADRLYEYFLIDVSVDAAQMTSRIVQGLATIQQFVQRCILDLEKGVSSTYASLNFPAVSPTSFDPQRWSWMKNYRVWEANRQVFLFPENYIEPELRPDKSVFFEELETAISESEITTETAESAFQDYLQKLDAIAHLKIVAQCTDPVSGEFHVFGRTDGTPGVHYHRIRSKDGIWAGWEKIPVDIPSEHLVPVFNNRRLYLYWLEFSEKPNQPESEELAASGSAHNGTSAKKHWEISLAWIERRYGKWSTKAITSQETGSLDQPVQGSTFRTDNIDRDPSEYRLLADSATSLNGVLQVPLRLLEASHIENIVARQKVITERIRDGYTRKGWFFRVPKYVTKTVIETEYVGAGTFFSRLDQDGYWSVIRPGGRLIPNEVIREDYINSAWTSLQLPPLVKTEVDWVNNAQAWKFNGSLFFMAPAGWSDGNNYGTAISANTIIGSKTLSVLGNASGELLLEPSDKDLLFQPPWKPFFFYDDHRSYLVEATTKNYYRLLSRDVANQTAADLLADPDQVDLNYAGQFLQASSVPADQQPNYGQYFSSVNNGGNLQQVQIAQLHFSSHYHPYSADLLARLVSGGVENVLTLDSQNLKETASLFSLFSPDGNIVSPDYPVEQVDFSLTGSYSIYNWEIFFHIPLLIASRFVLEKKFEDARRWFHFIFDPTTDAAPGDTSSLRFWKFAPLHEKSDSDRIQYLLSLFDVPESSLNPAEIVDKRQVENQLSYSAEHPFEPHGIARLRLGAYQKAVFMKYLDNLIEWADQLFTTDTRESINEATQIYVLAKDLLGPAPDRVPLDAPTVIPDYASLRESMDQDGDALAPVEDWLANNRMEVSDQDPTDNGDGDANSIAGPGSSDYFKIPENEKLASFWSVLDDRLYKIRNGLDINGNAQNLALFSPRLDPSDLVGSSLAAAGAGQSGNLNAQVPLYRFSVILPKALEFCSEVKSFGASLLSALEKNDAEGLGNLRARQEVALYKLTRNIRNEQISEAEIALETLRKSREVTQQRRDYYAGLERNSATEKLQMSHMDASGDYQLKAGEAHATAATLAALPDLTAGASGFGGSPHVTLMSGGTFLSRAANAYASVQEVFAGLESHRSSKAGIQAGWERRNADWDFQVQLADKELAQIDSQIQGGESRIRIAKAELASLELQLKSSQEIESFLTSKFTNQAMYGWMAAKLSGMYLKAYQMAYLLAKQAEACYTFERRTSPSVGISYDAWDGLRKGLLAGETLALDLHRLELEYMNKNTRDPEITKSVSLISLNPSAVIALKTTGICTFTLPEALFDIDHPGHYYRRIKSVSITVPCVTGPYSGINGQLSLTKNRIRISDSVNDSNSITNGPNPLGPIILSSGQGDTGMFETNLRDERFLPFEGCGVVDSEWELKVPQSSNSFDLDTISDVVLRIQYTATISPNLIFASNALSTAKYGHIAFNPAVSTSPNPDAPTQTDIVKVFSLRHEFADAWYAWTRDTSKSLPITLASERFPFSYRGKSIKIAEIGLLADISKADMNSWSGESLLLSNAVSVKFAAANGFGGLPFANSAITLAAVPADLALQITPTPSVIPNDLVLFVRYSAT